MGPSINTAGDEGTPFIAGDGSVYFSSDGHPSYGGTDIFLVRKLDDTWLNWTEPQNLGRGINTKSWDAYFTIPVNGEYAYMVSSRSGFGSSDIFRVKVTEKARPEPVILVKGKVVNAKTDEPIEARITYRDLENDEGTIFRYAAHENTVLNQIMAQLQDTDVSEVSDKKELITFIQSITRGANHTGKRDMVDMLLLVKKYYYHPAMRGSNSIKAVLPAVLNASKRIKEKYSQPIYGKNSEIRSLNFEDGWIWVVPDDKGQVQSPYVLLPSLHDEIDVDTLDDFIYGDKLADGGAAMTGYAKMQFMNISKEEHEAISKGLLKYCELDTLAMVLIWEHFRELTIRI